MKLHDVGMGDEGISALALLVSQGRMEDVDELDIGNNDAVTQKGIIALAHAIYERGLPMLECFSMTKLSGIMVVGVSAIHSLIKGCPRLKQIDLAGSVSTNDSQSDWITGMLEAAGREGKWKLT